MRNIFFSVIIPVYNAEKYLKRCIDSILQQTYDKFEVIIVNDGSTDNSSKTIEEYSSADNRVNAIFQKNKGALAARSKGIEVSKGEFCIFVDADDFLEKNALEIINDNINLLGCDLLIYNFHSSNKEKSIKNDRSYIFRDKRDLYLKVFFDSNYNSLWRKAIKTSLLRNEKFDNYYHLVYGEDLLMSITPYKNATKVAEIYDRLYHYVDNKESIMHNSGLKYFDFDFTVKSMVLDLLKSEKSIRDEDINNFYQISMQQICGIIYRMGRGSSLCEFRKMTRMLNNSVFKKKCESFPLHSIKNKIIAILLNNNLFLILWIMIKLYNLKNPIEKKQYC